jgi:hypothetical protein
MAFAETLWDLFPCLVNKSQNEDQKSEIIHQSRLLKIWEDVKQPKFTGETWESIISRVIKKSEWITEQSLPILSDLADSIYLDSESQHRDLSLFIYALLVIGKSPNEKVKDKILEAFKDGSEHGRKTQLLLKELLLLGSSGLNENQIDLARQIESLSLLKEKSLFRVIRKISQFHDDLLQGLRVNPRDWIKVASFSNSLRQFYQPIC